LLLDSCLCSSSLVLLYVSTKPTLFTLNFALLTLLASSLLTIDVAHPPRHPDRVEEELLDAWQRVRNSSDLCVLKIIHGHGSRGKGGSTKDVVRNWAFRQKGKFLATIPGEEYALLQEVTARLRQEVGSFPDPDLGSANPGITIIWVKKKT
jgi:hypothetical protein